MRSVFCIFTMVCAFGAPALGQEGDVDQGRLLAEENCARCHNIEPGGPMRMHPPSFAAIGQFRPAEQIPGRIWFPAMHAVMPPTTSLLAPEDVADLTAYIVSLAE